MLINFWNNDNIKFYCMNHKDPVEMEVKQGFSPFYACPKYMLLDSEHPDGHLPNEPMCKNQLSFDDAQDIVQKIKKTIQDDILDDIYADYTGYTFRHKHIDVTVLLYEENPSKKDNGPSICLGILNRLEVRR